MAKWIDYSFARPDPAAIRAAGYSGVCRYLTGQGKALTASERDALFAEGLDLLLNFEQNADNAKGGYAQGLEDGKAAAAAADALGAPRGMAIYFSVDYDTVGSYPAVVADYLKGCKAGLAGRYVVGVYGDYYVVTGALASGDAKYGWTTVAWSHGHKAGHIFQTGDQTFSHGADVDELLQADIGSWRQGGNMALDADAKAYLDNQFAFIRDRLTALFAVDTNGDGKRDITGTVQQADGFALAPLAKQVASLRDQITALTAAVAKVQPAGAVAGPVTGTITGTLTIAPK